MITRDHVVISLDEGAAFLRIDLHRHHLRAIRVREEKKHPLSNFEDLPFFSEGEGEARVRQLEGDLERKIVQFSRIHAHLSFLEVFHSEKRKDGALCSKA